MSNQNDRPQATGDPDLDRSMALLRRFPSRRDRQPLQVSTGAGIAIAGAWIAGAAVTITILLIIFVLDPMTDAEAAKIHGTSVAIVLLLLITSPMIAAYSISKVILSKD